MPNHIDILTECLRTQEHIEEIQEKLNIARIVARDDQEVQLELDRQQTILDQQRIGLEIHMLQFAASN